MGERGRSPGPVVMLLGVALCACGQIAAPTSAPTTSPRPSSTVSPMPSAATAMTASPLPGATSAPLTVGLAVAAGCALPARTLVVSHAPPACAALWQPLGSNIPGTADLASLASPRSVWIGPGVTRSAALSLADSFVSTQALDVWAADHGESSVVQATAVAGTTDNPIDAAVYAGDTVIAVPTCMLPTSLEVVTSPPVAAYLTSLGWPRPGLLLVATYPACGGVAVSGTTVGARPAAVTEVMQPLTQNLDPPLGTVTAAQNAVACGPPQLAALCG